MIAMSVIEVMILKKEGDIIIMTELKDLNIINYLGETQILGLGEIVRYNNRPKIKTENVAEHTFYVASTVLKLCTIFNLNESIKNKALEFAIVHDIPEILIGDVPYDTKVNNPLLREEIEKAEIKSLSDHMPEYLDSYSKFIEEEKLETTAYLVTKLADTISVLQYSNRELDLGNNTEQMKNINSDSKGRIQKLINKLRDSIEEFEIKKNINLSFENDGRNFLWEF